MKSSAINAKPGPITCPCNPSTNYQHCCEPIHRDPQQAKNAEQLMRARYSAYCLALWPFLTVTGPKQGSAGAEQSAMRDWCADKHWRGLTVVASHKGQLEDHDGQVEFIAYFQQRGQSGLQQHHELSDFARREGHWYFANGEALASVPLERNQRCPCGSGKKYKQCCLNRQD